MAQKKANEKRFGEDLELLIGESLKGLDLELPLREPIANVDKDTKKEKLNHEYGANQIEHLVIRDEELSQLQVLTKLEALEELDPLDIVSKSTESLLVKSAESKIEEFDGQVRNVTVDTGDSSDNVRTAAAADSSPPSWDTTA